MRLIDADHVIQRALMFEEVTGVRLNQVHDFVSSEPSINQWVPISERLPEPDTYVLLSFENFTLADIGRYERDETGGAFYPGDEDKSYASFGVFVNAWMPLPEPWKEVEE